MYRRTWPSCRNQWGWEGLCEILLKLQPSTCPRILRRRLLVRGELWERKQETISFLPAHVWLGLQRWLDEGLSFYEQCLAARSHFSSLRTYRWWCKMRNLSWKSLLIFGGRRYPSRRPQRKRTVHPEQIERPHLRITLEKDSSAWRTVYAPYFSWSARIILVEFPLTIVLE